ncbi:MAG: hypothetical protein KIS81_01090 [Maricaulaceae bacterium]|nr:hypothetical protein [Maricaulaceae bacterium]
MTDGVLSEIKAMIFRAAGGEKKFRSELPFIFRQAADELIDAPRTRRLTLNELEPNEKAILGIKIEAALREMLDFPRGKLDFQIGGHPVDVKFSMTGQWMIPPEAVGHACILTSADEVSARFSFGLGVASEGNLNKGRNRDGKTSFSAKGKETIRWIAKGEAYPRNIWESVSPEAAQRIFEPAGGTDRIVRLLETMIGQPVHRSTIQAVARQHDYMKRIRRNQGARDYLHPKGIVVLSGSQDGPVLKKLGIPLGRDFIMAYRPRSDAEVAAIMSKARHTDGFVKFGG